MHDFTKVYATIKPTEWHQTIASDSRSYGQAMTMSAQGTVTWSSRLLHLSSREELSKLPAAVEFLEGSVLLGGDKPLERGIGEIQYYSSIDNHPSGIYCLLGFKSEHYKDIWMQVRSATFNKCTISLEIEVARPANPLDDVIWDVKNSPNLFVLQAKVQFSYPSPWPSIASLV
jgi:hypothetical protein